jgi:hypothetical protein
MLLFYSQLSNFNIDQCCDIADPHAPIQFPVEWQCSGDEADDKPAYPVTTPIPHTYF